MKRPYSSRAPVAIGTTTATPSRPPATLEERSVTNDLSWKMASQRLASHSFTGCGMYHTREPNDDTYDAGWAWFSRADQLYSVCVYQKRRMGTRTKNFVFTAKETNEIHRALRLVHARAQLSTLFAAGAYTTDDLAHFFGPAPETIQVRIVFADAALFFHWSAALVLRYFRECEERALLKVHSENGEWVGNHGIRVADALRELGYDGWWYDDHESWMLCDDRTEDGDAPGPGKPHFRLLLAPGEVLLNLRAECPVLERLRAWISARA